MAIISIPFTSIALVEHAAGGAILRNAAGYIAGTHVNTAIVEAFSVAGTALQSLGSSAAALATNPYVIGGIVIGAVAVGAYCYFHGVPAPVAETIVKAGLASQTKNGLMVAVGKLGLALVLLGAAGYVAYRFYQNFEAIAADKELTTTWQEVSQSEAKAEALRAFGQKLWSTLGEAVWTTKDDVAHRLVTLAQDAIEKATQLSGKASQRATAAYEAASQSTGDAANKGRSAFWALKSWLSSLKPRSSN